MISRVVSISIAVFLLLACGCLVGCGFPGPNGCTEHDRGSHPDLWVLDTELSLAIDNHDEHDFSEYFEDDRLDLYVFEASAYRAEARISWPPPPVSEAAPEAKVTFDVFICSRSGTALNPDGACQDKSNPNDVSPAEHLTVAGTYTLLPAPTSDAQRVPDDGPKYGYAIRIDSPRVKVEAQRAWIFQPAQKITECI